MSEAVVGGRRDTPPPASPRPSAAPVEARRAGVGPAPEHTSWLLWLAVGAAALIPIAAYLAVYRIRHLEPLGWDIFGYIWQTKAVGHGALSAIGTRPGVPVLAALLHAAAPLSAERELVILPPVLAASLGLTCGAAVRMAYRLPAWSAPAVAIVVALWPGTARTVGGYEANLLMPVLAAAGLAILVQANGRTAPLLVAAGLFAAAAITHVAIFAAFAGVTVLFVLLSVPSFLRDRRAGRGWLGTDAGAAAATVLGGGAIGAGALFLAGVAPSQTVDTSTVRFLFRLRTVEEIRRDRPWASVPLGILGSAVAWTGRAGRPGRALSRFGLAWLAVAGAGVLLGLRGADVPGARFLLFALPVPVLAGLGAVGVAGVTLRGRSHRWLRVVLAIALVGTIAAAFARSGLLFLRHQYSPLRSTIRTELSGAAAYLGRLPGSVPIVFDVDQPDVRGAYTPKLRLNVARTTVPPEAIARTFVYVGSPSNLLAGRPTLIPASRLWQRAYDSISRQMWTQAGPALRRGAVVVILSAWNRAGFDTAMATDPSREVLPGVYALRGPVLTVHPAAATGGFGAPEAAGTSVWILAVLAIVGWGFTGLGLRGASASGFDRLAMAPAVGAGACVIGGFAVALLGGDPAGPLGIALLVTLAVVGTVLHARRRPALDGDADG